MTYREGQYFELNGHRWTRGAQGWGRPGWDSLLADFEVEGLCVQVQDPPVVPLFVTGTVKFFGDCQRHSTTRIVVLETDLPVDKTVTVIEGEHVESFQVDGILDYEPVPLIERLQKTTMKGDHVLVFRRKE